MPSDPAPLFNANLPWPSVVPVALRNMKFLRVVMSAGQKQTATKSAGFPFTFTVPVTWYMRGGASSQLVMAKYTTMMPIEPATAQAIFFFVAGASFGWASSLRKRSFESRKSLAQ
jgi:hypothetical protein